jgi:hypothetical protein
VTAAGGFCALALSRLAQGNRTLLRNLVTRPASTGAKLALTTFLPAMAIAAWNMSDPDRRAAYSDIAEFEKENNFVIVPPKPTQDDKGRWNVIKIPLSQEINNIANLPRRAIEAAYHGDPVRAGEVARAIIGQVSPVTPDTGSILSTGVPQAIKPAAEIAVNKNFFTGRDIVPERIARRDPEDQVLEHTSGTARAIARGVASTPLRDAPIVGELASPPKAEAFIKETFGGVGSEALNAFDRAAAAAGKIPPDQIGGESISEGTTRRFTKAFGGEQLRRARDRKRR